MFSTASERVLFTARIELTATDRQCLAYVKNAGGNATIASFDDDFEPIGPSVRARLMPEYLVATGERLSLTDQGNRALENTKPVQASTDLAAKRSAWARRK